MNFSEGKELEERLMSAIAAHLFVKQFHRFPTDKELENVKKIINPYGWFVGKQLPLSVLE